LLDSDECGNSGFQQSGPHQVSRGGTYFYTDISFFFDPQVDMCLHIYSTPVDVGNPEQNRVATLDDFGPVELEAGQDYWFVTQPFVLVPDNEPQSGAFFYVFAPPAEFRLNTAMGGSWVNSTIVSNQGFLMEVFDNINQIFLAWFTYDLMRPDPSVTGEIGDPGHRWLTAFGPFEGNTAMLDIEWSTGGVFNSGEPATTQTVDGTVQLNFTDCMTGTVTYDLGASGDTGVFPIQRIALDSVPLCEELTEGPGMPGPL
jgi:hypothetical protein